MPDRELATTRIALLELGEERRTAREGYALLDEKRMLLAARALALLGTLEVRRREWQAAWTAALAALRAALDRHGLHGLEVLPAESTTLRIELHEPRILGLRLPEVAVEVTGGPNPGPATPAAPAADPSPEALACAEAWRALLVLATRQAAVETALWRLGDEYRRTERRAAAIEQVLLPELAVSIATIEAALESGDQEETVRVRNVARRQLRA